ELLSEVESVIFEHTLVEDRMEAEDFAQLRATRTDSLRFERSNLQNAVSTSSRNIADSDRRRTEILKKSKRRNELPRLLEGLKKAQPTIDDKGTVAKLEELKKLREQQA